MKIAVYPGSFDPLTNGHLDIIVRASKIFDEVVVAVSINSSKVPMFTVEERCEMIKQVVMPYPNVRVDCVAGLIVEYVASHHNAVIVKGLRALSDFEMEFQMALMNRNLNENVETMFLMTGMEHSYLSSSIVKEVNKYGGDITNYVPKVVRTAMIKKRG